MTMLDILTFAVVAYVVYLLVDLWLHWQKFRPAPKSTFEHAVRATITGTFAVGYLFSGLSTAYLLAGLWAFSSGFELFSAFTARE